MEERIFHTGIYIPEELTGLQCETLRNSVLYNSGSHIKFGKVDLDGCREVLLKSVNSIWSDYTKGTALVQNYLNTLKVKEKGDKISGMRLNNRCKRVIRRGLLRKKGQIKKLKSRKMKQKGEKSDSILNRLRSATSSAIKDSSDSASHLKLVHNLQSSCMKRKAFRLARNIGNSSLDTIPTKEDIQTFETLKVIGSETKIKHASINNQDNQCSSVSARLFSSANDNISKDNSPLIVDVTNINQNKTRKNARIFSSTFIDKDVECLEEPLNATNLNSRTINSRKRKLDRNRSVEIISQNVKHRNVGSIQNGVHEDSEDSSSVISVGSDDEVIIIDNVTRADSSADIIIDTPPNKRRRHSSDVTVVDISSPQVVSASLPMTLRRDEKVEKRRVNRNSCLVPNAYKEYISVLGNKEPSSRPTSTARKLNSSSGKSNAPCDTVLESPNEASSSTKDTMDLESIPSSSLYGDNLYNPNPSEVRTGLRPIVIDGSNVAMGHTNGRIFSCRGLQICIDYFLHRNHKVIAFVPKFRRTAYNTLDREILDQLEKKGLLAFTPSRKIGNRLVVAYDDRYIVQYAAECGGVIVSTDNYRDLLYENTAWKDTIEKRLLMFTWVGDVLMFPQDPLGKYGPDLERFLRFP